MTQPHPPVSRKAYLIADVAAGITATLLAITVAHAAVLPVREERPAPKIRTQKIVAQAPAAAFVFGEPVEGYQVISPFGLRKLPWEERGRLHMGVDIAAPSGLPVRAVAEGVVARTGQDGAYGRFVQVRHAGGLTSFYAHLGAVAANVAAGTTVRLGDQIGQIGNTGSSTGSHLHFEVRDERGRPLNPNFFMDRQYAQADDLPLKAAARVPRGIRMAYVSFIPHSKRELMAAREADRLEAEAAQAEEAPAPTQHAALQIGAPQTVVLQPVAAKANRPRAIIEPARPAPVAASAEASGTDSSAIAPAPRPIRQAAPDDDGPIATAAGA